jgi:hypothetical protein
MEERKHRFTSREALPAAAARFLYAPLHRQLDRPPTQPPHSPISLESTGCSKTLLLYTLTSNNIQYYLSYLFNGKQNMNFVVSKLETGF